MKTEDMDILEDLVDRYTLADVLEALTEVCELKADHLRSNWQDSNGAKVWSAVGAKVAKVKTAGL